MSYNVFISYPSQIEPFVASVCNCLERMASITTYFHPVHCRSGQIHKQLKVNIKKSQYMVYFCTEESIKKKWQTTELIDWLDTHRKKTDNIIIVNMNKELLQLPIVDIESIQRVMIDINESEYIHVSCASKIINLMKIDSSPFDDLPNELHAKYEKDIIKHYKKCNGQLPPDLIVKGYPQKWPDVTSFRIEQNLVDNPLDKGRVKKRYGSFRSDDSRINVDARQVETIEGCNNEQLTFPEAGPRAKIIKTPNVLKIGILVSGGIAPGINSVIAEIVDRHQTYIKEFHRIDNSTNRIVKFIGFIEGFKSLLEGGRKIEFDNSVIPDLKNWVNKGGSLLGTSRVDKLLSKDPKVREDLLKRLVDSLKEIDILYIIGGEGSMRAAHAINTVFKEIYPNRRISIIGIPKTMDNDILWVWQSFGFLSAVEKARQDIIQLFTEVTSNPRVAVIQLFGSSSGFVVSHAALGSNVCDLALIPEMEFNMVDVCRYMQDRLFNRLNQKPSSNFNTSPYGLVVMAESAIPADFERFIDEDYVGLNAKEKAALRYFQNNGRKVIGQTPDELRRGSLKIVSRVLQYYIQEVMGKGNASALGMDISIGDNAEKNPYWENFRVFTNEPRHLIRSMEPTVSDVAYCIRLGTMAVDMALSGYTDCMVSQWLTEYVVVPLKLVILGRKQLPQEGVFWRTVVAKTGQIDYDSLV